MIYLDNAATTPVDPQVLTAMQSYFGKIFGNPSEFHALGQESRKAIEKSRKILASFLGCDSEEIIFTSNATESINLAHKGLIEALGFRKPHVITSAIEHKAVLETVGHLKKNNLIELTTLPVDQDGLVKIEDLEKAIQPQTVLVSIMYVNNEVGTIQPIAEIGKLLKKINGLRATNNDPKIYFHSDVTQAIQYLDCDVKKLGVDLLSLTGHKIFAPKGVGALFIKKGTPIIKQTDGGGQEKSLRAGTENVPLIVGLGKAVEINLKLRADRLEHIKQLQNKLITGLLKIPGVKLTGHLIKRAPHIASFTIEGVEGESVMLKMSEKGMMISTGSACTSQNLQPSHVLLAMGIPSEVAHGSIRLSLSKKNTEKEIEQVLKLIPKIITDLRKMAPKF